MNYKVYCKSFVKQFYEEYDPFEIERGIARGIAIFLGKETDGEFEHFIVYKTIEMLKSTIGRK